MANDKQTATDLKKKIREQQKELNDDMSRMRREINKKRW
jgi:hypothetical protein